MRVDTMSSEESGFEGDEVIVVKMLLWRSDTVSQMFKRLDDKITSDEDMRLLHSAIYPFQARFGRLAKVALKGLIVMSITGTQLSTYVHVNSCPQQPHHVRFILPMV